MPKLVEGNPILDEAKKAKDAPATTTDSVFSFQNIGFTVPPKAKGGEPKRILQGIGTTVSSRHVLAIMG